MAPQDCVDALSAGTRDSVEAEDRAAVQQQWTEWARRREKRRALLPPPDPALKPDDQPPFGDGPPSPWGIA